MAFTRTITKCSNHHRTHMEAFASLSRKAAGSQGRALSRVPQDTESPLDFRLAKINKNKKKKRIPQDAQSLERPSERTVFPFCLFWLKPGPNTGFQKGEFRACGLDQVPPGRASLRGWIAPGLRPGPVFACGRDGCVPECHTRAGVYRPRKTLSLEVTNESRIRKSNHQTGRSRPRDA